MHHPPATYSSVATTSMGGDSRAEGRCTAAIPSRGDPSCQPRVAPPLSPPAALGLRRRYPFPPPGTCARLRFERLELELPVGLDLKLVLKLPAGLLLCKLLLLRP